MKTINKMESTEIEIKKSKFISFAYPVSSLETAQIFIDSALKTYANATHVCFAYLLNSPVQEKCSDNGEPSGTAGIPMLNILKKMELKNVLLIVVRYYGGIKLGKGGLVRAYTKSCAEVLKKCDIVTQKQYVICTVKLDFNDSDKFDNYIHKNNLKLIFKEYGERVVFRVALENTEPLKQFLSSINAFYEINENEKLYL